MDNIIMRTNGLTKKYGDHYAVDHVNMTINKGDIYGFVGENGAGKTTIIRLITGLARPTEGSYEYPNKKNRIQAIVESPSLYLNLSATDNLKIKCNLEGVSYDSIFDILKTVGLSNFYDSKKKVRNFSLGMRQRLGIAMSLVGDPDLLIFDEPTNGLDPEGIVAMRNFLLELNKAGKTILISSHILDELSKVATKYGFIHHGKLLQEITADELRKKCQKTLRLKIENLDVHLEEFVSLLGIKEYKINKNVILIKDELDISNTVLTIASNGFKILEIECREENIEKYYLKLIGGKKNA